MLLYTFICRSLVRISYYPVHTVCRDPPVANGQKYKVGRYAVQLDAFEEQAVHTLQKVAFPSVYIVFFT